MSRLPTPGGDDSTWGDILNDFLDVSHNTDGTLKSSAVTGAGAVSSSDSRLTDTRTPTDGSVTNVKVSPSAAIDVTKLAAGTDGNVLTTSSGTPVWAAPGGGGSPSGAAGGDLTGTYPNPTIKSGVGLTGVPTSPTASVDTNTTQIASTAFVLGQASAVGDGTPAMDGSAARGTSTHYARVDHIHPSDTSRLAATATAGGDLAGTYPNPTLAVDRIPKNLLTTKGDVIAASAASTPVRVPVGSDGQLLSSDSTQTSGVKWITVSAGGSLATDTLWDAKGDLAVGTGANSASKLVVGSDGQVLTADSTQTTGVKWAAAAGGGAGSDTTAVHYLQYDTTGATGASSALQTAIDAGYRYIVIPAGQFKCDSAVFYDQEDGNASLTIKADGVVFIAQSTLPTVAEWETFMTGHSLLTGTKWFLFPSTYRTALSGGVVTCTGNSVVGTATYPSTKSGVHPHLIVDGGTWTGNPLTKYNAGFIFGNTGGAVELRSVHMDSARTLLSWTNYVDGNKMINCSGWAATTIDSTYDSTLFYQIASGDGVYIQGTKTSNYIYTAQMYSCNGATITSCIGGGFYFNICHGIQIIGNHTETANNIISTPREIYHIVDSHVTIQSSFDYLSNTITDGAIYLDDSGNEGKHSNVQLTNYFGRQFLDPSTSDPVGGQAIYINKMNDRSEITVVGSRCQVSVSDATFGQSYGIMGLPISGNGTNEPTLATGIAAGSDLIGSGTFRIYKYQTSSVAAGQNSAMTIGVGQLGNPGRTRVLTSHITPTFFDREHYGVGTLVNGTTYAYAAAMCNTLPDGTIQYGQATAEWTIVADTTGVNVTELYMPTAAANGGTLVVWRKTSTGVLTAPDRYVIMPVGTGATRLFDTGANISKLPWITTSVPVPNTVAASNHTVDDFYLGSSSIKGSVGGSGPTIIRRTADSSARNSGNTGTTLTADDTLLLSLSANQVWSFMAVLIFSGANATMDAKVGWTVPTGCTMTWAAAGSQANNVAAFGPAPTTATPLALLSETQALSVGSGALNFGLNLQGVIINGSTAGNITLTWAQATADAGNLILKANSHILLWQVA